MDIAALSMVMKQAQVQQAAGVSVLKMAMDTAEQQGQDMARILQQLAQPHLGGSIDLRG